MLYSVLSWYPRLDNDPVSEVFISESCSLAESKVLLDFNVVLYISCTYIIQDSQNIWNTSSKHGAGLQKGPLSHFVDLVVLAE